LPRPKPSIMNVIIIDDERDSIDTIQSLINLYNVDVNIVATGTSVDEGLTLIEKFIPDLVFLDVRLGKETGFNLLERIPKINFQVIFISGYEQYAIQAFKYSAIDYLLKPVDAEELIKAVKKAGEKIRSENYMLDQIKALIQNVNAPKPYLLNIPSIDGIEYINLNDIIDITAEGAYSVLFLLNSGKKMVSKSLGEFEGNLPEEDFCRIHNSHIINLKHLKKLKKRGGLAAEMTGGKVIPIARNRKDIFTQKMNLFMFTESE
jgi:two-component system, LytTR family, response regulator